MVIIIHQVGITANIVQASKKYQHQLNSYNSFFEALKTILLEDADRFYEQLLNEQVNSIISGYASNRDSSLPPNHITN